MLTEDGDDIGGAEDTSTEGADAGTAAPDAWDGDFAKLDTQEWWKTVPETARPHILQAHEERESAKAQAAYYDRLFQSDDVATALRAELAEKDKAMGTLRESLTKAEGTVKEHQTRAEALEARLEETADEEAYKATQAKFPDIFADVHLTADGAAVDPTKGAYPRFVALLRAGMTEDDAAKAARAFLTTAPAAAPAERPKERPVKLPADVAAASEAGSNARAVISVKQLNEDFATRASRLKKEYEDEEREASRK
jgi:hypothetical protein